MKKSPDVNTSKSVHWALASWAIGLLLIVPVLTVLVSSPVVASDEYQWTPYISDGAQPHEESCLGGVRGLKCKGDYCWGNSLLCGPGVIADQAGDVQWSAPISNNTPNTFYMCKPGRVITAMKCEGTYCSHVSVKCSPVKYELSNCDWTNYVSEEAGNNTIDLPTKLMTGIGCNGAYCDNKNFYACDFAEKTTVAAKVEGSEYRWEVVCAGGQNCANKITKSVSIGSLKEESWTTSTRAALAASLTASYSFAGFGAEATVSAEFEAAKSEASSIARSLNHTQTEECGANTDFLGFDIHAVWQLVSTTQIDGVPVTVKTCTITCMPDGRKPDYLPGSAEHIAACKRRSG
ncbi:MAG: hypothetical protein AAF557_19850 [Pseudomonadota bacterium]